MKNIHFEITSMDSLLRKLYRAENEIRRYILEITQKVAQGEKEWKI